jgi:8-oxo-dGTP pyrophosphatase MutT (NUDIX family)
MDASAAEAGLDRARVVLIRRGRLAAIERVRAGRRYWLFPGGGVEAGETPAQAALREAHEELGVPVRIGPLRALIHRVLDGGSVQRHWCFEATSDHDEITIAGGPELSPRPEEGTYRAVWLDLADLADFELYPAELARLLAAHPDGWPSRPLEAEERD